MNITNTAQQETAGAVRCPPIVIGQCQKVKHSADDDRRWMDLGNERLTAAEEGREGKGREGGRKEGLATAPQLMRREKALKKQ